MANEPFQDRDFDQIREALDSGGVESACTALARIFKHKNRFHELFDTRLIETRHRLDLPLAGNTDLEKLDEPLRNQVEEGYLAACREVGQMLLDAGDLRGAWMYLRTAGETDAMRAALEKAEPNEENTEAIIEIALYEGVHVGRGFSLLLQQYGTCNAITTFESAMHGRRRDEQLLVAGMLVQWLHDELLENLLGSGFGSQRPAGDTPIRDLVAGHEDSFGEYTTHVDTSHLSSVVRFARIVEDPSTLALALDLTEYGRRLHENFQHEDSPPFGDYYPSHGLFFAAQLGQRVDEAVEYFRRQAEKANVEVETTAAVEVYIVLLARLRRWTEAVEAAASMLPPRIQTTGFAPPLLELSRSAGDYRRHNEVCRERSDLLGFAIGEMEAREASKS